VRKKKAADSGHVTVVTSRVTWSREILAGRIDCRWARAETRPAMGTVTVTITETDQKDDNELRRTVWPVKDMIVG